MKRFKDLFESGAHQAPIFVPSVSLALSGGQTLNLKLDNKDFVTDISYSGKPHPFLSAMCEVVRGKTLSNLLALTRKDIDLAFKEDQTYWDYHQESSDDIFAVEIELLKASLDLYSGREDLYQDSSALVCRCFGVREADIQKFIKNVKDPTLEKLAESTKASLGCRSCLPQLKRMLMLEKPDAKERVYKNKPVADWLLEIDYMVSCFPQAFEWEMQVESFKNRMVTISFKKQASQKETEEVGVELQRFLAAGVDEGLSFFLRRA